MKRDANHPWKRTGRCLAAGLLALGLSASLVPGAAAAQPEGLPEWARSYTQPTASLQEALPAKFDLRHCDLNGDGVYENYVTPVKDQTPWGSCWAFGGIAAAETSILSYLGKSWEETGLDLSEKHLAWFAFQPVTAEEAGEAQAGEGLQLIDKTKRGTNAVYDIGGWQIHVTTLLSSGVGPVMEKGFPYQGKDGLTVADVMEREGKSKAEVAQQRAMDDFSAKDDWTIPNKDEYGATNRNVFAGFTLRDGNILPLLMKYDEDDNYAGPNWDGIQAVKKELMAGHGVCISFKADNSMPNQKNEPKYINPETWAHYTYEEEKNSHTVCIVGWDDNYSRTNFLDGHQPPANGAWIVKNSWGSEDPSGWITTKNGSTVGKYNWGVVENGKHTGYFYISYYDRSLVQNPETMTFTNEMDGAPFYPMQYDYMPAYNGFLVRYDGKENPLASANVFTADYDMLLTSVSTRTTSPDSAATLSVYLLDQDTTDPDGGELAAQLVDVKFPYSGYHRVDLDKPVPIQKGQRFAVVSSVTCWGQDQNGAPEKQYTVSASKAWNAETARAEKDTVFSVAKVNKGESWLYAGKAWYDWTEVQKQDWFQADYPGMEVDNFSIKAFGVPFIWDAGQDFDKDAVTASFNSGGSKATAVCAFYDKNGQMLGSSTEPITGKKENLSFPTDGIEKSEIAHAKIFLLDEKGSPMCGNETIPWIQTNTK